MLTILKHAPNGARNSGPELVRPTADIGEKPTSITGTDFSALCKQHLGKSAGDQLSGITGYPRASCYRYSGGNVPPAHFLAKLFASEYGEQFFDWFMKNNNAKWWQVRERHRRMGETIDNVR